MVAAAPATASFAAQIGQTALSSVISLLGFSSSDPVKDQQRIARIDNEYRGALGGDPNNIACLRDMAQGVSSGPNDPRQCAVGSRVAAAWAARRWLEYQARVGAAAVGGELIDQSGVVGPTIIGTAQRALSNPWVIGGVVLLGYLVLRRRGR